MAHYTVVARINAGDGKFPFVKVQFSKNHRPVPIEGATYYLRPSSCGKRTPIKIPRTWAPLMPMPLRESGKALKTQKRVVCVRLVKLWKCSVAIMRYSVRLADRALRDMDAMFSAMSCAAK